MKKLSISLEAIERNDLNERQLESYIREHIDIENVAYDEMIYYSDDVIEIDESQL